jgi:hypothetical protein
MNRDQIKLTFVRGGTGDGRALADPSGIHSQEVACGCVVEQIAVGESAIGENARRTNRMRFRQRRAGGAGEWDRRAITR